MGNITGMPKTISVLFNAVYYFLDHVIIIINKEYYRLLVIHHNQVLWDKHYKSIGGAKRSFARNFKNMACNQLKENMWSHMYDPDNDWLQDKLNLANNLH